MIKGSKHTEEEKKKMSKGIKKHLPSTAFKKGHNPWHRGKHIKLNNALELWHKNGGQVWNKGKHWDSDMKKRISLCQKGKHNSINTEFKKGQHVSINTEFKKGQKSSEETKKKMSIAFMGRRFTEEWKKKISESHKGNKSWNWKGGISYDKNKYMKDKYNQDSIFRFNKLNSNRKRRGKGILSIQTIQQVYEDNIKKYGTLTCYLCLKPIEFKQDCLEHEIPLSRGGTNAKDNLSIAHRSCNCKKHTKTVEEYMKIGGVS